MKILFFVLFLLAAAAVFVLENKLIQKLAYPITQRYLHCRIIVAVLLMLLALTNVYTVSYLLEFLDSIINAPGLSNFFTNVLPNRAYELVYMLLVLLGLNLLASLLVTVVILITKLVFSRKTEYVHADDYYGIAKVLHLPWMAAQRVYDDEEAPPRLNGTGFTMGIWVKGFKWAFAIVWILEMIALAVSILWGDDNWNARMLLATKSWYLLPMAGFLLLQQVQFFLEGVSEDEAGSAGSMEIEETQCGSIRPLMDAYQLIFNSSNALLLSDIRNQILTQDGLGSNDLGNQQIEDCRQPDVLNVITNQLQQCGVQQSEQYQNALIELLNGHSINFCDQCEGKFLPFLCAYLNFYMSQGRTVLVLCRDQKRASQLQEAMNREMERLNSLYSIWNICTLAGAENNSRISMLICPANDFINYRVFEKRQDFAEDLFCTVLADGVDLLSGDRLGTERLFGMLRSKAEIRQYITFTDINNDALRTAAEQAIKQEIIPFSDDAVCSPDSGIMIWREEGHYRLQQSIGVGSAMSPYMGTALPLALTALKYDFPRVYLISSDEHGTYSFSDVLSMSAKEVSRFIGKNMNLKSLIRYHLDEALQQQELSVTIVYDTDYNFLNAMMFWQKYGGSKGSLLHVISPAYALRDYFAANYHSKHFDLKNNAFNALIPHYLGTRTSHMLVLLVMLCDKGLTEKELMEKVKEYNWSYDNVNQLLRDCLKTVLDKDEIHSVYECFHFEEEKLFNETLGKFEVQTRVSLIDATIRERLCRLSGRANLICQDNTSHPLSVLSGNLFNYYLQQQIIPVNGHLYQVRSISDGNVHAAQVLPHTLPEYYQISNFVLDRYLPTEACMDIGCMTLRICTAEVTRNILGYVASSKGNQFAGDSDYLVTGFPEALQMQVGCANVLEFSIRRSEFGDKAPEAARLFAYLLKDFAKTLFPATHQNLFAAVYDPKNPALVQQVLAAGKDAPLNDLIRSLVPSVNMDFSGDSDSISVYVVESSCIEFGMVQMLYSRYKKVIMMMREYLSWYLESNQAPGPVVGSYLHFGSESIPDIFAPEALLALCQKITPETETASEPITVVTTDNTEHCTFCGRPTMFPVVLGDGRRMCAHCKDHQLTQKDEIKTLFLETQQFITEGYRITLPKNLHVRFQSAEAIAQETGGVDGGRILGFYNSGNHQLWLEARGPKIAMQSTLIHELTHAWQFHSAEFSQNLQKMLRKFPRDQRGKIRLLILEGHAVFMEVETMRRMHEDAYADRIHASYMLREDEYGTGYRLVRDYLIQKCGLGSHITPFSAMILLLQDVIDGKVVIQ